MGKFGKSETRHFGKWSLASNPLEQVVGILEEVEPGDFRLELSGSLHIDGCESPSSVPGLRSHIVDRGAAPLSAETRDRNDGMTTASSQVLA
jgi:hypothetical protein